MASIMVSWNIHMLQFGESTIHRIIVVWLVFTKVIFSCLNLKPDGFLPYSMPEAFNKTGHDLTDIIIVSDEFKPALHSEVFGHNGTYT